MWQFFFLYGLLSCFVLIFGILFIRSIVTFYKVKNERNGSSVSSDERNIPQVNKEKNNLFRSNNSLRTANTVKKNKRIVDASDLPFIIVSNRSCDSEEECKKKCVQMYPQAPDGSKIKYKSDEFEFDDSGKLQFLKPTIKEQRKEASPVQSIKSVKKVVFLLPDDFKEKDAKEDDEVIKN